MRTRLLLPVPLVLLTLILLGSPPTPAEEAVRPERIDKLIEQMGSGTFAEREKATQELDAIGVPALEALRKAVKSEDAEVRRRAEELVKKIEKQAESARVLAAKRVHLVYKDTPLLQALADFEKKSGYPFYLHDPDGRLKERTVTLDTGETTFWRALALFCEKAELTEATIPDVLAPQRPPVPRPGRQPAAPAAPALPKGAPAPAAVPRGAVMAPVAWPALGGKILLKDGKLRKLPSDDRTAIRVHALPAGKEVGPVVEGEILVNLEASAEPKLQWQGLQSVRIERAVDDQGQKLGQVTPQVPAGPGGFGGPPGAFAPPGMPAMMPMMPPAGGGGLDQLVQVRLKKGERAAKSLKELRGTLTANVLSEATPMIKADNLAKAAGKIFKGAEGGHIKILEVKTDEKKTTTIRLEFEAPPNTAPAGPGMPAMMGVPPGVPVPAPPVLPAPPPAAPPPGAKAPARKGAPAQVQVRVQIQGGGGVVVMGGGAAVFGTPTNGLAVRDAKGNELPVQVGPQQFQLIQQPGGVNIVTTTYTFTCRAGKDQGEPAEVVYLGRKRLTMEIPFALEDVPLP